MTGTQGDGSVNAIASVTRQANIHYGQIRRSTGGKGQRCSQRGSDAADFVPEVPQYSLQEQADERLVLDDQYSQ